MAIRRYTLFAADPKKVETVKRNNIMSKSFKMSGISGGITVEESIIDKKGRIVIPRRLRQASGLREGEKVKLTLEDGKILVMRPVAPDEFIHEMEACIKEGSRVPKINPLEIKKIWENQWYTWMPTIGYTGLTDAYLNTNTS